MTMSKILLTTVFFTGFSTINGSEEIGKIEDNLRMHTPQFKQNVGQVGINLSNQTFIRGLPIKVSKCIESVQAGSGSDFYHVVQLMNNLGFKEANQALVELTAVNYGVIDWINFRTNASLAELISFQQSTLNCQQSHLSSNRIWIAGFGDFNRNKPFGYLPYFSNITSGGLIGYDFRFFRKWNVGAAGTYSQSSIKWRKPQSGTGNTENYTGAVYTSYQSGSLNADISVMLGKSSYQVTRIIKFSTLKRDAKSHFDGMYGTVHLGADFPLKKAIFKPFGSVLYNLFKREGFKESGAESLDLDVRAHTQQFLRFELGVKGELQFQQATFCWEPYFDLSWIREMPLTTSYQVSTFPEGENSCEIRAASYKKSFFNDLCGLQAGLKLATNKYFSSILGYKGQYNSRVHMNEVHGRIELEF